ncbi:MAG: ABC transporter substrate-binding protein [Chloroflexota bacterium]
MNKKWWPVLSLIMTLILLVGCATPTPEVIEKVVTKEVEKVVTQVVKETVKETVVVEGTPQVVEKEVTKVVEKVVTATPEPQAPGGGTFVGSLYITISMIDPHRAVEFSDGTVLPLVFEGLVAFGADGEWKGVLAESWDVSADGLTWTFHLRQGVKFHNGREMTADDVIYSFGRILDENTGASMRSYFTKIGSYEAVDPYTVKFVLTGGAGTFLSELGLGSRAAIIARECVTQDGTVVHPIGTGPFEFLWWKPGEEFRVKRFDDYWGQVAKIDEAVFKFIPDDTVRLTALQTGEIDWMRRIPYDQVVKIQGEPIEGVEMALLYESRTVRFNFNCTRPPFDDPRVRQAIAHLIDKDAYNEAIWYGVGNPHNQPFSPGSFLELPVDDPYRSGDIEAAKALLAEAGYPDGLEINAISHVPYKNSWEFLVAVFSQVGITVNVEYMDSAQWTKQAKELDYDAMLASQSGIYHWDRTYSYFEQASSASWLVGGYQNDAVSELLAKGRNEADLTVAKEYYTQILQLTQDDMAAVFIGAEPDVQVWRTWVEGYEPNASNTNLVGPGWGLNYISLDNKPE